MVQKPAPERRGLTATEAAARIGVGIAKFYELRKTEPELAGYQLPNNGASGRRLRRYDTQRIDAFIERCHIETLAADAKGAA